MADQTRKPKPKKEEEEAKAAEQATTEANTEEVDDLLDEIDEVLETNAEEFVRAYVQKGGQALVPLALVGAHFETWVVMLIAAALVVYGFLRRRSFN
jgi:prokaryotic ubiquitin-like protein Pup